MEQLRRFKCIFGIIIFCLSFLSKASAIHIENLWIGGNSSGGEIAATDYSALSSCKGYWKMDDTGNELDDSTVGSQDDLTETSGTIPVATASPPTGFTGSYRTFADIDTERLEHADGGSTDISGESASITLFIRFQYVTDTAADMRLISKYRAAAGQRQYSLFYDDSEDNIKGFIRDSADSATTSTSGTDTTMNDGNWHTAALVCNNTDIRLYADGVLDNTPAAHTSGILDGTLSFAIGAQGDFTSEEFDGNIYEAGIWDVALSAEQILEMHNNGINGAKN